MADPRPLRRPPRDLDATIDRVPVRNPDTGDVVGHRDVSVIERVCEAIRTGASLADAANRAGMSEGHLRQLRREGAEHARAFYAGQLRNPRGAIEQKIRLHEQMGQAETEQKMALLAVAGRLAHGGMQREEWSEETDGQTGQLIKRTRKVATLGPDPGMVRWMLASKWPAEFGRQRVELTGADGGPLQIDTDNALAELRQMLDDIGDHRERSAVGTNGEHG